MKLERVRVRRVGEGEDAGAWKRALEDASWLAGAKVLKDEPGSSGVRRATVNGRDVVVKCRLLNTVPRRVKAAVGMGHGDKQWRGAERLRRAGIATARPLALGLARVDGVLCEMLVLEYVAGPTVLEVLAAIARGQGPGVREQHELARAVGRSVLQLIKAKLANGDHKPSNLVVLSGPDDRPCIAVIDCVAIERFAWMGIDDFQAEEMAASLITEPTGCGCRPRKALWMLGLRAMFADDVLSRDREDRHTDLRMVLDDIVPLIPEAEHARPKVDPLASRP